MRSGQITAMLLRNLCRVGYLLYWLPIVLAAALLPASAGAAQADSGEPAGASVDPLQDPDELLQWASSYFGGRLDKTRVPGAVLVVVNNGKPLINVGFGVTTPDTGQPIDPQKTLFRVGSITKVMTAIAVLQLIDEGLIDPSAPVNTYLKRIEVADNFARQVTVRDLLLHKGGFGSELRGAEVPYDKDSLLGVADSQRLLVPRVREPGLYPAYDNNGWGLLGMVAADAAATDYRSLIEQRVFTPLGMHSSGIGLPDKQRAQASLPHNVNPAGDVWPIDYSLLTTIEQGAGNATATGADMARFMIALLQKGELDGERILSPAGYRALTDFDANRIHPRMPGYGQSVYEFFPAGRYAIRHDGGISGFVSSMVLYPDDNIGVFFSINAQPENPFNGDNLSNLISGILAYLDRGPQIEAQVKEFIKFYEFHELFASRYVREGRRLDSMPGAERLADETLRQFEGRYRPTREEYGNFIGNLRARILGGQPVRLLGDGVMQIGPDKYRQNDDNIFEKEGGPEKIAFANNEQGIFMGSSSLFINKKIDDWETPLLTILPLLVLPLLILTGLLHRGAKRNRVRLSAKIGALAAAAFLILVGIEAEYANALLVEGYTGLILLWRVALSVVVLAIMGCGLGYAAAVFEHLTAGIHGAGAALKTLHLLLLALAAAALTALAYYWNLIAPWIGT